MTTEFWSPSQVIFGPFVFSFQFLVLVSLKIDKTDYISCLMKLFNKFEAKKHKFWQGLDKVRKSKMDAIRLISGVSFMSIFFIAFKKRRGGGAFDAPPLSPVQGRPKKPSLNRVDNDWHLRSSLISAIKHFRIFTSPGNWRTSAGTANYASRNAPIMIQISMNSLRQMSRKLYALPIISHLTTSP